MKRNILLFGKAGSGKDSVAEILRKDGYRLYSLAQHVRDEFQRFYGRPATRADRAKLIEIGETYKRIYGDDVWVRRTLEEIRLDGWGRDLADKPVAITDGRYLVEFDTFTNLGYATVRVWAPDEVRYQRLIDRDGIDQRAVLAGKEDELDAVTPTENVFNTGSLEHLETTVKSLLRRLNG